MGVEARIASRRGAFAPPRSRRRPYGAGQPRRQRCEKRCRPPGDERAPQCIRRWTIRPGASASTTRCLLRRGRSARPAVRRSRRPVDVPAAPWREPSPASSWSPPRQYAPRRTRPRRARRQEEMEPRCLEKRPPGRWQCPPGGAGSAPVRIRELGARGAQMRVLVHPRGEPLDPSGVELGVRIQKQPVPTAHVRPGEVGARGEAEVLFGPDDPGVRQQARHGAGAAVGRGVVDRDELGEPAQNLRANRFEAALELALGVVQNDRHRDGRRRRRSHR